MRIDVLFLEGVFEHYFDGALCATILLRVNGQVTLCFDTKERKAPLTAKEVRALADKHNGKIVFDNVIA